MSIRNIQFAVDGETGERKDLLKKVTWPMIVEAGLAHYENEKEPSEPAPTESAEQPPSAEKYYLMIEPAKGVHREFDALREDRWITVPFEEIKIGETFRVRDDANVLMVQGFKKFRRDGDPLTREGYEYVEVVALK
jgi:hypothetical protein